MTKFMSFAETDPLSFERGGEDKLIIVILERFYGGLTDIYGHFFYCDCNVIQNASVRR